MLQSSEDIGTNGADNGVNGADVKSIVQILNSLLEMFYNLKITVYDNYVAVL